MSLLLQQNLTTFAWVCEKTPNYAGKFASLLAQSLAVSLPYAQTLSMAYIGHSLYEISLFMPLIIRALKKKQCELRHTVDVCEKPPIMREHVFVIKN